jgi:DNA (cytosine-5)-methyltransferase 1
MKILNLYAGIGGNRKLWGDEHEIIAVEYKPEIAKIYQDFFPNDKVIIGDAHQYLLDHFSEFDFIWSSPPCPSHSRVRFIATYEKGTDKIRQKPLYPDMKLYQEILLLNNYFGGLYCVENVIPFYPPLVPATKLGSHLFWTNFVIPPFDTESRDHYGTIESLSERKGFDLSAYKIDKRLALRNAVEPEVAKHILHFALNPIILQNSIF